MEFRIAGRFVVPPRDVEFLRQTVGERFIGPVEPGRNRARRIEFMAERGKLARDGCAAGSPCSLISLPSSRE